MCAPDAALGCGPRVGTVACSVPTVPCPVRPCSPKTPLAVAHHDRRPSVPRLAGKHVEQLASVVDTARCFTCRADCAHPSSRSHLDLGSALDGDGVHSECAPLWPHALPVHRAILSRDDRACACPWLYVVGHLRVDYVGGDHRRRKQNDLVGDRAGMGQILVSNGILLIRFSSGLGVSGTCESCHSMSPFGPSRHLLRCGDMSDVGGTSEVARAHSSRNG